MTKAVNYVPLTGTHGSFIKTEGNGLSLLPLLDQSALSFLKKELISLLLWGAQSL